MNDNVKTQRGQGARDWVPYDWDRDPVYDMEQLLDAPARQWRKPIDAVERAFWRGVVIGAAAEAGVIIGIAAFVWTIR